MHTTPGWLDSDSEDEDEELALEPPSPGEEPELPPSPLPAPEPLFPWASCLLICGLNLVNSASYMMTMPFVAFMILSFYPGMETKDVGYFSGLLEASFHVGCIPGALFWSWVADRYGRRPALLYGLFGTALCCLAFGAAPNFACALAARFAWGLLNGNVGVAKTVMSELAADVHMARAFSYIGLNAGAGRILGPALGGLLSQPAQRFPGLTPALFVTFPFLLPCLVCALLALGTMVASYFVLPETLEAAGKGVGTDAQQQQQQQDQQQQQQDGNASAALHESDRVEIHEEEEEEEGQEGETVGLVSSPAPAAPSGSSSSGPAAAALPLQAQQQVAAADRAADCAAAGAAAEGALASYLRLLRDPVVFGAVGLYTAMGSVGIVTQELFPLYAINPPSRGGFSLTAADLGLLNVAAGVPLLLFQLLLFPPLSRRFGVVALQTHSLGWSALAVALAPLLSLASGSPLLMPAVYGYYIAATLVRVCGFVANFVVVANSAPHALDRAKVNGLGQALVSAGRAVCPALVTPLFALSVSDANMAAGWPFNYALTFTLSGLALALSCWWSSTLPRSLDAKRV